MDFDQWVGVLREAIQEDDGFLEYSDRRWKVIDRKSAWKQFGTRMFDDHLDVFKACAVDVLGEIDPKYELDADERFAAAIHGKVLLHSGDLREGIAQTVALLGNEGDALKNCSRDKARVTADKIVRDLLASNDWRFWASINFLLPILAEGSPTEFLDSVQNALISDESPFDELFRQEESGTFGSSYISGLLWALEALAWSGDYIVRVATILADMASRDPGGTWSNRPDSSLVDIVLPWYPHTFAPFEKRLACLKAVKHDHPDVAWNVIIRLLPNQHQTTSGTHKPSWFMVVPKDWKPTVTNADYYEEVGKYAEMAVEMAYSDLDRLTELVEHLDNLPRAAFESFVEYLSSEDVANLDEDNRLPIWSSLTRFSRKHRRFQDSKWALPLDVVDRLDEVAGALAPKSLEGQYRYLFENNDIDLYEENGDFNEQSRLLDEKRQQAVLELWENGGFDRVMAFSKVVASSYRVGWAFASVDDIDAEAAMLPDMVESGGNVEKFIDGYVWKKYHDLGQEWVDQLPADRWTVAQCCRFLTRLPFFADTWARAANWLRDEESLYWVNVNVKPYYSEKELIGAVDKLLQYGRPIAALDCLYVRHHRGLPLDHTRTITALLEAVTSEEPRNTLDQYHALDLIKALQEDSDTDPDGLFSVEWAYVALLDRHDRANPVLLEKKLADDPDFFCEVIQLIFRPKGVEKPDVIDERTKAIATNAWRLLHEWQRTPGLRDDGSFSSDDFQVWLEQVKEKSATSGHLEVAMSKVGEVLYYCPPDTSGLWINEEIARQLNAFDAGDMRNGFRLEVFNSRGAHWVDPTGDPERQLAQQWREKAEAVEAMGYARFGATLRDLADSYDQEAARVLANHAQDDNEDD